MFVPLTQQNLVSTTALRPVETETWQVCKRDQYAGRRTPRGWRDLIADDNLPAIRLLFFFSVRTNILATVAPIGVKFTYWYIGPGQVFSLLGAVPPGGRQNPKFWAYILAI